MFKGKRKMKLEDRIYGQVEIVNPVIESLIKSPEMQRLKDISQFGVPDEFYWIRGVASFYRYEHSIGVMNLLTHCKAKEEEQIAGLLHDISHTAFSHVYDWVIENPEKEEYQDSIHQRFFENSEVSRILKSHGLDTTRISNLGNYKLLERGIPDLCADRIDYCLREPFTTLEMARCFIKNLRVYNGKIVFGDKESAEKFGRHFLKCQVEHWGSAEATVRYHFFSELLKMSLKKRIIRPADFLGTETPIMEKIKSSRNLEVKKYVDMLSGKINYVLDNNCPDLDLRKKFRYVDPEYFGERGIERLSSKDTDYKNLIEIERKANEKGNKIRLLN